MKNDDGIKLKYYQKYLDRLLAYAKATGIKVKYKDTGDDGVYIPNRHLIRISPNLSDSHEISALLHELGHSLDDALVGVAGAKRFKALNKAYIRIYRNKHTPRQLRIVLRCERRAWKYGRVIAKKLHIRLGAWYDAYMQQCIEDYKK